MPDDRKVTPIRAVHPPLPEVDLAGWLASYLDHPALAAHQARSVVLMVETVDGQVGCVSQSTAPLDAFRLIGLLDNLRHRLNHGKGSGL